MAKMVFHDGEMISKSKLRRLQRARAAEKKKAALAINAGGREKVANGESNAISRMNPNSSDYRIKSLSSVRMDTDAQADIIDERKKAAFSASYVISRMKADAAGYRGKPLSRVSQEDAETWQIDKMQEQDNLR